MPPPRSSPRPPSSAPPTATSARATAGRDLAADRRMDWTYTSAPNGNVVQTGKTALDGVTRRRMTLVIGFGDSAPAALSTARSALDRGYARGRGPLRPRLAPLPRAASSARRARRRGLRTDYDVSVMTLAAHEDKANPGAYIASPSMPWVWRTGAIANPSRRLPPGVVARPLPDRHRRSKRPATAAGARRALAFMFERQQKPDGCFPQNSLVTGEENWHEPPARPGRLPDRARLAAGPDGRRDLRAPRRSAPPACILANGPQTQAGALGEPGGLVARDDRRRRSPGS